MLIAKSGKPSGKEIETYVMAAFNGSNKKNSTFEDDRKIYVETLLQLLERAQLQPDEIVSFISVCVCYTEFAFIESLIPKYEHLLSPECKRQILTQISLVINDLIRVDWASFYEEGMQFFSDLLGSLRPQDSL